MRLILHLVLLSVFIGKGVVAQLLSDDEQCNGIDERSYERSVTLVDGSLAEDDLFAVAMQCHHNKYREYANLPPVSWNSVLASFAANWAQIFAADCRREYTLPGDRTNLEDVVADTCWLVDTSANQVREVRQPMSWQLACPLQVRRPLFTDCCSQNPTEAPVAKQYKNVMGI
ncbi:uncharacterized protein LOC142349695 [Convolutriloba macropyga]|uniref:uncharacterized protein LOC142349695 n=1 Tax=Convolutriloba macropyga TaxID=536237 RepID=UPI003F527494